jgi:hypothetical protein
LSDDKFFNKIYIIDKALAQKAFEKVKQMKE